MRHGNSFGGTCLYVYNTISFESIHAESSFLICSLQVHLQGVSLDFVYEGHRVKSQGHSSKNKKFQFPQSKTSRQ